MTAHGIPALGSGAHAERRMRMLRSALEQSGSLSVAEAAALTGASTATAARDLSALAESVGARRVRGGVVADEERRRLAGAGIADPVSDVPDTPDLARLAVNHAEHATWCLHAGDVAAATVHARLSQAMATLAARPVRS